MTATLYKFKPARLTDSDIEGAVTRLHCAFNLAHNDQQSHIALDNVFRVLGYKARVDSFTSLHVSFTQADDREKAIDLYQHLQRSSDSHYGTDKKLQIFSRIVNAAVERWDIHAVL
jgi:hypothetical protein